MRYTFTANERMEKYVEEVKNKGMSVSDAINGLLNKPMDLSYWTIQVYLANINDLDIDFDSPSYIKNKDKIPYERIKPLVQEFKDSPGLFKKDLETRHINIIKSWSEISY